MLAAPAERAFVDPAYLFEPKWDGFRCLAFATGGGRVSLYSRTLRDITNGYPDVTPGLAVLPESVVDGELVVCDGAGIPRFELMQQRNYSTAPRRAALKEYPVGFISFDLCWLEGEDLRPLRWSERRARLEALCAAAGTQITPTEADGLALYEVALARELEGIVGKRVDAPYRPGARTQAWRKVKTTTVEHVVVAGFTAGTGGRASTLGSLVMAQWDGPKLRHVGEVGTGFDGATLVALRTALEEIAVAASPFGMLRLPGPARQVTWVEPGLVVVVEHRGRTNDGSMRAPSFKGVVAGADPSLVRFPAR